MLSEANVSMGEDEAPPVNQEVQERAFGEGENKFQKAIAAWRGTS